MKVKEFEKENEKIKENWGEIKEKNGKKIMNVKKIVGIYGYWRCREVGKNDLNKK